MDSKMDRWVRSNTRQNVAHAEFHKCYKAERGRKIETNRKEKDINKRHMHFNRHAIYDPLVEMQWALFSAGEMQQICMFPL